MKKQPDLGKWIKKWGTLGTFIVAVLALCISLFTLILDNIHFQQVTKPDSQNNQTYQRLTRLDEAILRKQEDINKLDSDRFSADQVLGFLDELNKASQLRNSAEVSWNSGDYGQADNLISQAYAKLEAIPSIFNWPPWVIHIWYGVGIVVALILGLWLARKKSKDSY